MTGTPDLQTLFQRFADFRAEQRMEEALDTIQLAATQAPTDSRAAFGLAQTAFECWRPAAELFAKARSLVPDNPGLIRNHALALAAEGEGRAAETLLDATVATHPGWLDGHRALAATRITSGQANGSDRSYAAACAAEPGNLAVRLGWFQHHAVMKNWDEARQVLDGAPPALLAARQFEMARLYLDSEAERGTDLHARFAAFEQARDPGMDLCRVRFLLRTGRPDETEAIASRHIDTAAARIFWPYLSLCWRLTGNPKAQWLEGNPALLASFDLDFSVPDLLELADVLRGLHRLKSPYPEQSVRGGTQTDRQLFFHPDPAIQKARLKIFDAVRCYVDGLPHIDIRHPLLGPARDSIAFEGSWSVRLAGAGHHTSHTHVKGWVSSAFYVSVPADMGDQPAGWLSVGAPPPELSLSLNPTAYIEPKPARLVLFSSTIWHATAPFAEGERLTIAFDIALPR